MADDHVYTVGKLITRALTHLGVVSYGDAPEGGVMNDCMVTLNLMLSSWIQTSFGMIAEETKEETLKAMTNEVAIEGFLNVRGQLIVGHGAMTFYPERVNPSEILSFNAEKGYPKYYSMQWEERKNKGGQIAIFTVFNFAPMPVEDLKVKFSVDSKAPRYKNIEDHFLFPDTWARAVEYNLSAEVAADFGLSVPSEVKKIANESRDLVRVMCYKAYPFLNQNDLPVRTF